VWGNGRGGCQTVSQLDAIPPYVLQSIQPNEQHALYQIFMGIHEKGITLQYGWAVAFERQLSATEAPSRSEI